MKHRLRLIAWSLATALFFAGWMWLLLPPAPRDRWPIQGDAIYQSADGRRLVCVATTWVKRKFTGTLSGGGPPPAERCDLHVYDAATGDELAAFAWDKAEIKPPAISNDGRLLAALTVWGGQIREWDIDAGKEVARYGSDDLPGKDAWALQLRYSPAGDLLALVRMADGRQRLWHCRERRVIAELNVQDEFAPNDVIVPGFLVAQAGGDRWKVWRLDTGEFTGVFPSGADGFSSPPHHTISNDGKLLAHGTRAGLQLIHADGATREFQPLNADSRPVLSPNNRFLAAFSFDDMRKRKPSILEALRITKRVEQWATLRLHELDKGRELAAFPQGKQACFRADEQTLFVLSENGMLELWDIPPRPPWLRIGGIGATAGALVWIGGWVRRRRSQRRRDNV